MEQMVGWSRVCHANPLRAGFITSIYHIILGGLGLPTQLALLIVVYQIAVTMGLKNNNYAERYIDMQVPLNTRFIK